MRAIASVPPPGGNGTTTRTNRTGQVCAAAAPANSTMERKRTFAKRVVVIWSTRLCSGAHGSVQVERMALERRERHVLEDVLVRALEHHARGAAGLPGLDPAQHVQAPAVAVLQAAEAQVGTRRDEIVALGHAELEECVGHLHAHEVRDPVL